MKILLWLAFSALGYLLYLRFVQVIFLSLSTPPLAMTTSFFYIHCFLCTFCPLFFFSSIFSFILSPFYEILFGFHTFQIWLFIIIRQQEQVFIWINIPSLRFFLARFIGGVFYSFSCWDHFRALAMPAVQVLNIHSVPVIKMRAFEYQFY